MKWPRVFDGGWPLVEMAGVFEVGEFDLLKWPEVDAIADLGSRIADWGEIWVLEVSEDADAPGLREATEGNTEAAEGAESTEEEVDDVGGRSCLSWVRNSWRSEWMAFHSVARSEV